MSNGIGEDGQSPAKPDVAVMRVQDYLKTFAPPSAELR